ncbi:MAG TPA: DUF4834 family protein [Puia sp.]|jgi:hypothetical protein
MNIIFLALLIYLLYRFVAGFLIPVFRTTRHVREQFNQRKGGGPEQPGSAGAGEAHSSQDSAPKGSRTNRRPNSSKVGEYIDFEEVKK